MFVSHKKKKEMLGSALITCLTKLGKENYVNRLLITRLLASRFLDIFPDLTNEERESSLLALLAKKDNFYVLSLKTKCYTSLVFYLFMVKQIKEIMFIIGV